jgi:hypothetical protein
MESRGLQGYGNKGARESWKNRKQWSLWRVYLYRFQSLQI